MAQIIGRGSGGRGGASRADARGLLGGRKFGSASQRSENVIIPRWLTVHQTRGGTVPEGRGTGYHRPQNAASEFRGRVGVRLLNLPPRKRSPRPSLSLYLDVPPTSTLTLAASDPLPSLPFTSPGTSTSAGIGNDGGGGDDGGDDDDGWGQCACRCCVRTCARGRRRQRHDARRSAVGGSRRRRRCGGGGRWGGGAAAGAVAL